MSMSILGAIAVPHPPLIMPDVGRGEERKIQKTIDAYREASARIVRLAPDLVVLTSPHTTMYADYFHISPGAGAMGDFGQFRAAGLSVRATYDERFVRRLSELAQAAGIPAGTLGERHPELDHATMIPLRFLQEAGYTGSIVRIGLSGLSAEKHYELGRLIARTAAELGRKIAFVASGDLSHKLKDDGPYGFAADGPVFDERMQECFASGDFLELLTTPSELAENAAECGLRSFWIMAGALDRLAVDAELLSYEGPFGVGYGVASFLVTGRDDARDFGEQFASAERRRLAAIKENEDVYVRLARLSLETYVTAHGYAKLPDGLPGELTDVQAGAFVSLKKDGRLRGCIGTILPTKASLAEEILHNAIAAGTQDPRFDPVTADELPHLVYDVDVLTTPERIADASQLDVKRYGVIVERGNRRGLLLPDLAGVDSALQQIDIARRKGNIGPDEAVTLYRFEVVRHV